MLGNANAMEGVVALGGSAFLTGGRCEVGVRTVKLGPLGLAARSTRS